MRKTVGSDSIGSDKYFANSKKISYAFFHGNLPTHKNKTITKKKQRDNF